ncbi:MAG: purine-binding chemotaxis protein CheW [Gammaproteobacteria bacterium]|nr:purine-binding chemotaxis protein CheW [Gammaproteobacteria bacterium]
MAITAPFELLQELDARCRENASGLPVNRAVKEDWIGIGYRINDLALLTPMDEVSEILPLPETIRVPGVKDWVRGLANVRGSIMPVLDMKAFLTGETTLIEKESRVLIINIFGIAAGLLVEEVYGLRRFKPEEHIRESDPHSGSVAHYLAGAFVDQVRRWNVFSIEKLVKTDQFIRVV